MTKKTLLKVDNAQVLDLSKFLGKVKNRIDKLGVELEGAWNKIPVGSRLEHDGSVAPHKNTTDRENFPNVGEIVSKPMAPAGVGAWIKKNYPGMVNDTCGLHVHMSFPDINFYSRLMEPEYQDTIIHYLTLWAKKEGLEDKHPIWPRLRGESEYCARKHWPDKQAQSKRKIYDRRTEGNRYTIVNYCYQQHETIEIRVLPMMKDAEQAIRAVQQVVNVTNACIVALTEKEKRGTLGEIFVDELDVKKDEKRVYI